MVQTNSGVACLLTSSKMRERLSMIRKNISTHLLDKLELDDGYKLRFMPGAELREDIELLIELEAECCAFLNFDLSESEDKLILLVTGPVSAKTLIAEVFI